MPNIVYTIRVGADSAISNTDENSMNALTESFPLVATDWSDSTESDMGRSAELAANIFGRYGIGWTASSWNADPRLVVNAQTHNFAATRWGSAVQRGMLLPPKLPLTGLLPGKSDVS